MNPKRKTQSLSESEIDRLVVAQSEDDSAWEKPVRVQKAKSASVVLPSELSARAAFAGVKREIATAGD